MKEKKFKTGWILAGIASVAVLLIGLLFFTITIAGILFFVVRSSNDFSEMTVESVPAELPDELRIAALPPEWFLFADSASEVPPIADDGWLAPPLELPIFDAPPTLAESGERSPFTPPDSPLFTENWVDVLGIIRVPPTWHFYEVPFDEIYGPGYLGLRSDDEIIQMGIGMTTLGNPFMLLDEAISYQPFEFDGGHVGYMAEMQGAILWLRADGHMSDLWLRHGGDRSIFTENEEIITAVARMLQPWMWDVWE
ncbi:MAG: hypothetical protein FWC70_06075 [Defluviitaleaceae bacterium]|nr:hypothetical protein [Defluviitaleaceae bacterium]